MLCPKCNTSLSGSTSFCPNCGALIALDYVPQQQQTPAAPATPKRKKQTRLWPWILAAAIVFGLIIVLCIKMHFSDSEKEDSRRSQKYTAEHTDAPPETTADTSDSLDEPTEDETLFDASTTSNYYQDLTPPKITKDEFTYKLYQAWWEEDTLILQIYFINGFDHHVSELWIDELSVYNGDSVEIASAQIGPVDETMPPIESGDYALVTFYLVGSCIEYPNAALDDLFVEASVTCTSYMK